MRSLNLDQLRSLEVVVDLASFTAAAKRLNLSQSTISVQIRELERRFGLRLIERLGKRAAPTPAGRELIEHARRVAAELQMATLAMKRHRDGSLGQVKIGTTTTALNHFLAPVLETLRARYPQLDLAIQIDTTAGQVDRILRDEIDFGIVNLPVREKSTIAIPLRTEQLVAILPAHVTDVPARVTPAYLATHRLILETPKAYIASMVLGWLSPVAHQLSPAMQLDNFDTIRRMVAVGLGASVVPLSVIEAAGGDARLIVRPLKPRLQRTIGLIVHKDKVLDRAMRLFREEVLRSRGGTARA